METKDFSPTTINEYFEWLEKSISKDNELYVTAHSFLEKQRESFKNASEFTTDRPFLSVLTRTQGKRPEMLNETLLCLMGQSNKNFEVMLMCHNLNEEQEKTVSDIVSDLPEWMRKKVRIIPVEGGNRTRPLSVGFEKAKGLYVSILDDDDIVFDNWVEAFYETYKNSPGRILHSYAVYQNWETVPDTNIPRCVGAPQKTFCRDFKLIDQLSMNSCPTMSLAFPTAVYQELGIRFDETLTTTEDWDFLMRSAFVVGVSNNDNVTSVYRNWLNAENSQTLHNQEEWDKNLSTIINKFLHMPIIMPEGSILKCINTAAQGNRFAANIPTTNTELFYDDGEGFRANKTIPVKNSVFDKAWLFMAEDLESLGDLRAIRFDPYDGGNIIITDAKMMIVTKDGEEIRFNMGSFETNGYKMGDELVFLKSDPQFVIKFNKPITVKRFYVNYNLNHGVSDAAIDAIVGKNTPLIRRIASAVFRRIRKVIGR